MLPRTSTGISCQNYSITVNGFVKVCQSDPSINQDLKKKNSKPFPIITAGSRTERFLRDNIGCAYLT